MDLDVLKSTIKYIRSNDPNRFITLSFEFEQTNEKLNCMFEEDIDFFFVGRQFAPTNGWADVDDVLKGAAKKIKGEAYVISIWGAGGSKIARVSKGEIVANSVHSVSSYPPPKVVDTCGAGDTYLAATIFDIVVNGSDPASAIDFASRVAGAKVGISGYNELAYWGNF